ncbi:MAG: ABC transporter permease subunit [Acidimicrobiales bacterium]|nr:ABC transporter permease subunit [Acidimicrobiales bacterium]
MTAEIFDRGYRQYGGERTGVPGAMKTLIRYSVRRSLGLGRSARFKLIPVAIILFSFTPAVVFVGLAALLPDVIGDEFLPTYAEYYGFIVTTLYLFAAFVAPDLLCTDRRTSMLGVYLASPLNRRTYLASKAIAVAIMLGIVTIGPPLFLMIALWFEGSGPSGFGEFFLDGGQIIASGIMMSAVYTAVSFAVSAATDRTGTAIAGTIGLLVGTSTVATILAESTDLGANIRLMNLLLLPVELAFRIHGEVGGFEWQTISTTNMWLAVSGIITGSSIWVWSRYGPLLVRR